MGNHVFICYAREDEDFVLKLATNLKARGVPVWLDQWNIPFGADWDQSIDDALYDCARFLIVLSPAAVRSKEVRGELRTALNENKSIVPAIYQHCRVPRQLQTLQYADFTHRGPQDKSALDQLVLVLQVEQKAPRAGAEVQGAATQQSSTGGREEVTPETSRQPEALRPQEAGGLGQKTTGAEGKRQEEKESPRIDKSPGGEVRRTPPWGYGIIGIGVVVVLLLVVRAQWNPQQPEEKTEPEGRTARKEEEPRQREPVPEPPQELEPERTEGVEKEMVQVPAGEFWMGCNEKVDRECEDEKPGRKVYLDAFSIDKHEVTVAEYGRCVAAGKCAQPDAGEGCNWGVEGRADHPINCVDWEQARAYCEWAGKRKRLPTEAEWEKAARGTDGRVYPWGNHWDAKRANVDGNGTVPVWSYQEGASPYGTLNMSGNVWEWVQDWYDKDYYQQGPDRNPKGPDSGEYKILRGGSWDFFPGLARVSYRGWGAPGVRVDAFGFRCAQ
jgi:formylglycine-generating enzyme required for sulfatase activity